ncbi:hypothetical protein A5819_002414 [Enterococcus sp. 7E2_DIV0204]|uniref:Lipoprotein n=1 Tax=Candidatus Enterococcus lemimoniae TaxID=1834167 RepID=A0ABZ2T3K4_9ENTE|nr:MULTISPECIES: hypothetical protein [unclassified Enterococcus]OTN89916.1 hypothetical protein A5819_002414 [Enterococcus sp. 7E2_DIV0204]OTO68779.1 hypothetical protein A5866_000977 [Enterococcus sp. 12C11_DIV0727]OTP52372.1 hypothetical protein A5884_001573 [Enterococcus sp. 7D2_DIV0200]
MQKKRTLFLCATMILLLIISACSANKKTTSIEHEQLLWHDTREKPFGRFDYPNISKEEGLSLLKDKFKVKVPDMIAQAEALMEKEVATDGVKPGDSEYTLYAEGDELRIQGYYPFSKESQLETVAAVEFTYLFRREEKDVRLRTQSFSIVNVGEKEAFTKEKFHTLLEETAKIIDLPKTISDRSIENFGKTYQELDSRPAAQRVKVYSNDEEMTEKKRITQSIVAEFSQKKELKGLQVAIVDRTE